MNEQYYLEKILTELEEINVNTNLINGNVEEITQDTIEITQQLTEETDSILYNNMQQIKNGIALIGVIGALFIIYYFIMRCLK